MNLEMFKRLDPSGIMSKIKIVSKNYPNEYEWILQYAEENGFTDLEFKEKIYYAVNNLKELVQCKNQNCTKKPKYRDINRGYYEYCCNKCQTSSDIVFEKRKQTSLKNWGIEIPQKSDIVKAKIIKTNNEIYGGNSPMCSEEIKTKSKTTSLINNGFEYPNQNPQIKKKGTEAFKLNVEQYKVNYKETSMQRYNTSHPWQNKEIRNKCQAKWKEQNNNKLLIKINNLLKNHRDKFISMDFDTRMVKMKCSNEKHEYESTYFMLRRRNIKNSCLCTICNPIDLKISGMEIELKQFIENNYKDEIIHNDKTILKPKHLDIYLPKLNLGIEFNGLYWHGQHNEDNFYHLNKYKGCLDKGIRLFMIWEDEWIDKGIIIDSILSDLLKLNNKELINITNCIIKEVSNEDSIDFLEDNHIEGPINAGIRLGLYYEEELVSLMCLMKVKGPKAKDDSYQLSRFCNRIDLRIVDAEFLLFNYFLSNCNVSSIISKIDRSKYVGELEEKLGFVLRNEIDLDYWWCFDKLKRENKTNWTKPKLVKLGYSVDKTADQILEEDLNGYKIWNCGYKIFEYRKKNV